VATVQASGLDLDKNLAHVARQWAALLALCDEPAVFRARAESVSGWDVGQHVFHCAIPLGIIAGVIESMLTHPQQGAGLTPTHPIAMPLLERGIIPRGAAKAADFLVPPDAPDAQETRTMLQLAKGRWESLRDNSVEIQGCPATFAHFLLGNFTGVQWARFICVHTAHHLKIVRDILTVADRNTPYGDDVEALR